MQSYVQEISSAYLHQNAYWRLLIGTIAYFVPLSRYFNHNELNVLLADEYTGYFLAPITPLLNAQLGIKE